MKRLLILTVAALALTACHHHREPVVVTDSDNTIIDMPPGVRWDVDWSNLEGGIPLEWMISACDHMGGEFIIETLVCQDVDY